MSHGKESLRAGVCPIPLATVCCLYAVLAVTPPVEAQCVPPAQNPPNCPDPVPDPGEAACGEIQNWVHAPGSTVAGKTLSEWSMAWWQWTLSIPIERNPAVDPNGPFCEENQDGPVFFLPGTGEEGTYCPSCTVPCGKYIFLQLINGRAFNDIGEIRGCDEWLGILDGWFSPGVFIPILELEIDGCSIPGLTDQRQIADCFDVSVPECNLLGNQARDFICDDGNPICQGFVSDGFWVMLDPLPPGRHIIHSVGGLIEPGAPEPAFQLDFTFEITVEECPEFIRGDSNADDRRDLSDAVYTLMYLFAGGPPPPCLKSADSDDSGLLDISDAVYFLDHLFSGGPEPPPPFPSCGPDPTVDALTCEAFPPCE